MKSEKFSGSNSVRELIAVVAGPRQWTDTRESWLARAARRAGVSYRQTKAIWYGEITDDNHRSARLMRDAAERYAAIADVLNAKDAEFFGTDIGALIDLARSLRSADGADDSG